MMSWGITLLALLVCLTFAVALLQEMSKRSVFFVFWLFLLGVYGLPALGDTANAVLQISDTSPVVDMEGGWVLVRAHVFAIGFTLFYILARSFGQSYDASSPLLGSPNKESSLDGWLCFGLLIGGFAVMVLSFVAAGMPLLGTYSSVREDAPATWLLYAYTVNAFGGVWFYLMWQRKWLLAAMALATVVVGLAVSGAARQLIISALGPVIIWAILGRPLWIAIPLLVGAGSAGLVAFSVLQVMRWQGSLFDVVPMLATAAFWVEYYEFLTGEGDGTVSSAESWVRVAYYFFMQTGIEATVDGAFSGQTFFRLLLFFVPTSLSGGLKPRDFDESLYVAIYAYDQEALTNLGTMHATIFGHMFMNFYWFGMLVGAVLAVVISALMRLFYQSSGAIRCCLGGCFVFVAIMWGRGAVYNTSMVLIFTLIAVWMVSAVSRRRVRSNPGLGAATTAAT